MTEKNVEHPPVDDGERMRDPRCVRVPRLIRVSRPLTSSPRENPEIFLLFPATRRHPAYRRADHLFLLRLFPVFLLVPIVGRIQTPSWLVLEADKTEGEKKRTGEKERDEGMKRGLERIRPSP